MQRTGGEATTHGLRSTFRDWCGETGVDRELAERCLAHKVGSDAENAYARSSLIARRRPIMEAWGAFVAGARDNVLPFEKAAASVDLPCSSCCCVSCQRPCRKQTANAPSHLRDEAVRCPTSNGSAFAKGWSQSDLARKVWRNSVKGLTGEDVSPRNAMKLSGALKCPKSCLNPHKWRRSPRQSNHPERVARQTS